MQILGTHAAPVRSTRRRRAFAGLPVLLIGAALAAAAQQAAPQAAPAALAGGTLEITVVQGEGGRNNVRARTAVAPAVVVKDGGKPVAGAEVLFQLPPVGPGGNFSGWLKSQTVRTDAQGQASATAYTPNTEVGRFNIKVTAAAGGKSGSVVIAQNNVEEGGGAMSSRKGGAWKWIAILGGAAVAGGVAAAVAGGDDAPGSTSTPITITSGPITVAGPR